MIAELTPLQRSLARHALGLDRKPVSYRNFYALNPGEWSVAGKAWHAMVAIGAARRAACPGQPFSLDFFYLTLPAARCVLNRGECLSMEDFPEWLR